MAKLIKKLHGAFADGQETTGEEKWKNEETKLDMNIIHQLELKNNKFILDKGNINYQKLDLTNYLTFNGYYKSVLAVCAIDPNQHYWTNGSITIKDTDDTSQKFQFSVVSKYGELCNVFSFNTNTGKTQGLKLISFMKNQTKYIGIVFKREGNYDNFKVVFEGYTNFDFQVWQVEQLDSGYVIDDQINDSIAEIEEEKVGSLEIAGKKLIDMVYPVGSIYLSVTATNPSSLFGGIWAAFGQGRTLIGVNTNVTAYNAASKTGGEETVTLTASQIPSHSHSFSATTSSGGAHTHTVSGTAASNGAHTHTIKGTAASAGNHRHQSRGHWAVPASGGYRVMAVDHMPGDPLQTSSIESAGAHTHSVSGTAASNGAHTHTVSGTAASNGAHTHTVSGTTGGRGGGESHNNLQPYITVYMWQRTA